jgi:hypothetical protein
MPIVLNEKPMSNDDESWKDETEIDPEVRMQALLAMPGDKERRAELVRKIAEKTGQPP